jgi:hypothetical protein
MATTPRLPSDRMAGRPAMAAPPRRLRTRVPGREIGRSRTRVPGREIGRGRSRVLGQEIGRGRSRVPGREIGRGRSGRAFCSRAPQRAAPLRTFIGHHLRRSRQRLSSAGNPGCRESVARDDGRWFRLVDNRSTRDTRHTSTRHGGYPQAAVSSSTRPYRARYGDDFNGEGRDAGEG